VETILERSKNILNLSYLKRIDKVPPWMKKQKILIEFARDAALHIIASQHSAAPDSEGKCSTCGGRKNENPYCSNSFHLA